MGVFSDIGEYSSSISAPRLFKALVVDAPNLIPNLIPQIVKSIVVHGDGGPGSIRQINFVQGSELTSLKNRIDEINEESLTFNYTTIEGEILGDKYECIGYEIKFEAKADGGSINKMTIKYYTKGDFEVNEEEIKLGKERAMGIYKIVEAYLLSNPHVYA
ncbi:major allergen Pru ar 1-like [Senna tora]|uniref:Major allergen Pru ar 1-like n=1 Tax=Senna tora TaxID=362788 RepID=A0A834X3B1_9FABA|nr:major allergen Pru ar 1-like [Senna tora]